MQAESAAPVAPAPKDAGKRAAKAKPLLFLAMVPAEWTLWSVIEVGGVLGLIAFLHVWVRSRARALCCPPSAPARLAHLARSSSCGVPDGLRVSQILLGDDGFWSHRLIAECKANARCASELKPGQSWLPGGQVDHGDSQSRSFRQSLPQLVPAAAVMLLVSWGVRWLSGTAWPASSDKREATARSVAALPLSVVQLCWRLVSAVGFAWLVLGSESLLLLAAVTVHWAVVSACLGAQRCVGGARAGGCAGGRAGGTRRRRVGVAGRRMPGGSATTPYPCGS